MKIFVSWSGDLSKEIARILKQWIPSIIQSVDTFISSEDIEKGEKWGQVLAEELEHADFGIVCLTKENINAPWINFEAGAIAKEMESKVTALMINVDAADMQGPLKLFQATKIEQSDFFRLVQSINNATETPLAPDVLSQSFSVVWSQMNTEFIDALSKSTDSVPEKSEEEEREDIYIILNEVLQTVRDQSRTLINAENNLIEHIKSTYVTEKNKNSIHTLDEYQVKHLQYLTSKYRVVVENLSKDVLEQNSSNLFMICEEIWALVDIELYKGINNTVRNIKEDASEIISLLHKYISSPNNEK